MSTFVCDCGKNTAHFYDTATDNYGVISHDEMVSLSIPGIQHGDLVVIEDAHLRSREKKSLAQPFSFDQLVKLKQNSNAMGISIRLFPQQSTPKARTLAGYTSEDKTDEVDVVSIANYLQKHPHILNTLKHFTPKTLKDFQAEIEPVWKDKADLNDDVNEARNVQYSEDKVNDWIQQNLRRIYDALDDECRDMLTLKLSYAGGPRERMSKVQSPSRLYTVVATLMRPDGSLRLRSGVGKLPFWKYVKEHYFAITPYHQKGGVVASNIKHHWRRSCTEVKGGKNDLMTEDYEVFRQARAAFDKKLQKIFNVIRQMIVSDFAAA